MCLYAKYLANMTQVSDVAPGPIVSMVTASEFNNSEKTYSCIPEFTSCIDLIHNKHTIWNFNTFNNHHTNSP
jgi:hypothetical protein